MLLYCISCDRIGAHCKICVAGLDGTISQAVIRVLIMHQGVCPYRESGSAGEGGAAGGLRCDLPPHGHHPCLGVTGHRPLPVSRMAGPWSTHVYTALAPAGTLAGAPAPTYSSELLHDADPSRIRKYLASQAAALTFFEMRRYRDDERVDGCRLHERCNRVV